MPDSLNFQIARPKVIYQQIREHVRELIKTGELEPGTKLPATSELAKKWNTQTATVHAALSLLVKEGLITRRPKKGTFVSERNDRRLTDIGIYYDSNIWLHRANEFKRAVHVELARLLSDKKIRLQVWFDPRPEKQRSKPWQEIEEAVSRREIQALIATDIPDNVVAWLQQLSVPAAYFTYAPVPNKVALDFDQFAETSVALLKKQGCRSAGIISILEPTVDNTGSRRTDLYARFSSACQHLGLQVRESWIRTGRGFVRDESQEDFGYREFLQLWKQRDRPDGLVVFPDTSVPGVVTAILEKRVNVPEELRVVAHKHREIDLLCPIPVSYLYSSTREIALALFSQIQRQFEGNACAPIVLPFSTQAKQQ